jgi:putative transposase
MFLKANVKIHPSEEQKEVLWSMSDQCRYFYNLALADRNESWKIQKSVNCIEQLSKILELIKNKPKLKRVEYNVLKSILKRVDNDYRSFLALRENGDKNARSPRFRGREYFMTIPYNQSGFYTYENYICFSHKVNNTKLSFDIGNKYKNIKQVEIYNSEPFHAKGDFCVSVVYEITETHNGKLLEVKTSALDRMGSLN